MKTSMRTRSFATILAVAALAPAAPAVASEYGPFTEDPRATPTQTQDDGGVFIPRLPRDPSEATAFVAEVSPEAASAGSGFDLGDAAIGAGAGLLAAAVATAAVASVRDRRRHATTVTPASQGA